MSGPLDSDTNDATSHDASESARDAVHSHDATSRDATSHDATESVRDAVRSLDARLDDLRRESSWRAIEGAIAERPAITPAPPRTWRLPVFALATLAVIVALVVLPKPTRDETAPSPIAAPAPSPVSAPAPVIASESTTLSAATGQRTVFVRDGVTFTLVGPSVATIQREADLVRVTVTKGLVVADRTPTAPALAIDAGDNHVVSRDARFAVRVEPSMVVLGAGEQARQIVERHALDMGAPPLAEPSASAPTTGEARVDAAPLESAPPKPATTTRPETAAKIGMSPGSAIVARAPDTERRAPTLVEIRVDAAELYKRAEAALAIRDPAGARELLERLLAEYPTDSRVDAARYDLALIARSFGQRQRALELLDALIANGTDENLKAAARRLRPTLLPR